MAPNLDYAAAYAIEWLRRELPPTLTYHSSAHTSADVVPAVERLARSAGVGGQELLLLQTAAYYHDIGFIKQREGHESAGAAIAAAVLPRFGYSPQQTAIVAELILATEMPQRPRTPLEELLADADLDSLGREDFLATSMALRDELAAHGQLYEERLWYERQLRFLQSHRYFSAAARALRDQGKARNIVLLRSLITTGVV